MINKEGKIEKKNTFTNDVIFIDGLWGSGKSLLSAIVSGMKSVEKVKIEEIFEYLGILLSLNKITEDAAKTLIQIHADKYLYYSLLGREVNFRLSDDTGIFKNPNPLRYIKRLFVKDILDQDKSNKETALCIMGHMNIFNFRILKKSLGDRLKFIEVVRHPLYMFNHWYNYLERFDDPREFTISTFYKRSKIPWFANDWEREYESLNNADRALKSIIYTSKVMFQKIDENISKSNTFFTVSFESLVLDTEKEMKRLEVFLGRKHYPKIKTLLKKQKIPRKTLSSGKGHEKYGWQEGTGNEEEDFQSKWSFIKLNCSNDLIKEFKLLINIYNDKFPSILKTYK
jgi:hypothetical protein